jgi:hypothetical protein
MQNIKDLSSCAGSCRASRGDKCAALPNCAPYMGLMSFIVTCTTGARLRARVVAIEIAAMQEQELSANAANAGV